MKIKYEFNHAAAAEIRPGDWVMGKQKIHWGNKAYRFHERIGNEFRLLYWDMPTGIIAGIEFDDLKKVLPDKRGIEYLK